MRSTFTNNCIVAAIIVVLTISYAAAQTNQLMLPVGHTGRVYSAVYSPVTTSDPMGGKFILTTSDDKTMMLWQAEDGKLIRIYNVGHGAVKYACFNWNASEIVSGTQDGVVDIRDITTGAIKQTFNDEEEIREIAASPVYNKENKGYYFITCYQKSAARLRSSGKASFSIVIDDSLTTKYACFSPDGKTFLTIADSDPYIRIWDVATAQLIKKIQVSKEIAVYATFNKDGSKIITCSIDDSVRIWDSNTGTLITKLDANIPDVLTADISSDGKWIATCSEAGITRLFDATTGKKINEWQTAENQMYYRGTGFTQFSPNGNYLLTLSGANSLNTWIVPTCDFNASIRSHTSVAIRARYSPSGSSFTTIHDDGTLKIWNAKNGKLLGTNRDSANYTGYDFSPANSSLGSKYIAYSIEDSIAYFKFRNSTAEIQKLVGHHGSIRSIQFSPDGNHILTSSYDSTAIIWQVTNSGNGIKQQVLSGHKGFVVDAVYSPDGKHVITSSYDRTAIVWDVATGKPDTVLQHDREVIGACFSPDSKKFLTTCWDHRIQIRDAGSYKLLATISDSGKIFNDACFSPSTDQDSIGGKYVLTAGPDNDAVIWDASTGKKIKTLKGHSDIVMSATYSPDGKYILTTSYDNFCRLWDVATDSLLYSFLAIGDKDYLLTDAYGRFDGSSNARQMIHMTCGTKIVDLNQFKDQAWEPGLGAKLLGNSAEPITAKAIDYNSICSATPEVVTLPPQNNTYEYLVKPGNDKIGKIEVYVNNRLVKTIDTSALIKKSDGYHLAVDSKDIEEYLVTGDVNKIDLNVTTAKRDFNARGNTLLKVFGEEQGDSVATNLYIVSIGISMYAGEKIKLNFASKDATDFAKAVDIAAKNLLNTDNKEHVFSYTLNTEPGNANWPFKNNIKQTLDSVANKATPNDIVILFFAGHGVLPKNEKSLYLLSAEATNLDLDKGQDTTAAISTDELIGLMKNIKASKQVLILDACNSGQAIQHLQALIGNSRGEVPADQQRALQNLQDKSGTYILSASASGQSAYESGIYNQGLLTYSLLYGLKRGDGLRDAKFVDLTMWFNNAASNVEILAKDIGGRQDPQIFGNASFDVGLVDSTLKEEIVLPTKKKVFGATLLIGNIDLLNDSLGLSDIVDAELMNRNAMGKQSKIAFAANSKSIDTYYVKGRYELINNRINLDYFIFESGNKKTEFKIEIPLAEKASLGEKVAASIEKYFTGN